MSFATSCADDFSATGSKPWELIPLLKFCNQIVGMKCSYISKLKRNPVPFLCNVTNAYTHPTQKHRPTASWLSWWKTLCMHVPLTPPSYSKWSFLCGYAWKRILYRKLVHTRQRTPCAVEDRRRRPRRRTHLQDENYPHPP